MHSPIQSASDRKFTGTISTNDNSDMASQQQRAQPRATHSQNLRYRSQSYNHDSVPNPPLQSESNRSKRHAFKVPQSNESPAIQSSDVVWHKDPQLSNLTGTAAINAAYRQGISPGGREISRQIHLKLTRLTSGSAASWDEWTNGKVAKTSARSANGATTKITLGTSAIDIDGPDGMRQRLDLCYRFQPVSNNPDKQLVGAVWGSAAMQLINLGDTGAAPTINRVKTLLGQDRQQAGLATAFETTIKKMIGLNDQLSQQWPHLPASECDPSHSREAFVPQSDLKNGFNPAQAEQTLLRVTASLKKQLSGMSTGSDSVDKASITDDMLAMLNLIGLQGAVFKEEHSPSRSTLVIGPPKNLPSVRKEFGGEPLSVKTKQTFEIQTRLTSVPIIFVGKDNRLQLCVPAENLPRYSGAAM